MSDIWELFGVVIDGVFLFVIGVIVTLLILALVSPCV